MLRLYVVLIKDYSIHYHEFYWAKDASDAQYQAIEAHPTSKYGPVTLVPYVDAREEAPTS